MNRISRFAATATLSGGLALTGLGLSADSAQAVPAMTWCPGQALPDGGIRWDMTMCHNYVAPPEQNHSARLAVLFSAGWER